MAKQKEKQTIKFLIKNQKKLVVFYLFVLLAFAGLVGRLIYIVQTKEAQYQKQVLSQQKYDSTTIPYKMGDILDATGMKLATSQKVYNLVIDAAVMRDRDGKYIEPTMEALAQCFPALDMTKIRAHVKENPESSWYVPLRRLTYNEISSFLDLKNAKDSQIKGVWFEEEYKRYYPNGSLASSVIGFARSDNVGQYGLEEFYNQELIGTTGRKYGYLNDDLALERTLKPAVDGNNVHSTIDINIQKIIEKHIQQFNEENRNAVREGNGAEAVGCIIMKVDTGEILGMAETPTFDLNDTRNTNALLGSPLIEEVVNSSGYVEHVKTKTVINEQVLSTMTEDQILLNLSQLWKNYCINTTYEPGSTIKPFTVAAALESGSIRSNATYECNGYLEIGGYKIKCHSRYGDGVLNLEQAVAKSCNVALMKIGQAMGKETFSEFQSIFNFGLKTNIDMAGEGRTASLVRGAEQMDSTDLATYTFGQNFNVTMIQVISGFCSLINGGYYYEPHMVNKITNSNGAVVQNIEPRLLKQTISESTSALIRQYCKAVVTDGTGKTARPAGYMIGGKTGTAQTQPRGNGEYVVSFIGFAPYDDPEIAIYVVVDRPNANPQDDAKYATRLVRSILTEVLPYMNIYMTEPLSEAEQAELETLKLENTYQYSKPQNDQQSQEDNSSDAITIQPEWKSFPVDPETGYLKDPATGTLLDPETGNVIGEAYNPLSE